MEDTTNIDSLGPSATNEGRGQLLSHTGPSMEVTGVQAVDPAKQKRISAETM
jgi:hypothetical protein